MLLVSLFNKIEGTDMINEDMYEQYEDEYSCEFQKFTRRAPKTQKADKSTKHDEINAKRRERQSEKDAMVANKDNEFIFLG